MANVKISIPDDLLKQFANLQKTSAETMKEMVEAGGEVMHKAVLKRVPAKTGKTKSSLKKTGGHTDSNGVWYDNIRFVGYDGKVTKKKPKGTPFALKAMAAEYGTPTQKPRPFLRPAMKSAEKEAYRAMQEVYDRRAEK